MELSIFGSSRSHCGEWLQNSEAPCVRFVEYVNGPNRLLKNSCRLDILFCGQIAK